MAKYIDTLEIRKYKVDARSITSWKCVSTLGVAGVL